MFIRISNDKNKYSANNNIKNEYIIYIVTFIDNNRKFTINHSKVTISAKFTPINSNRQLTINHNKATISAKFTSIHNNRQLKMNPKLATISARSYAVASINNNRYSQIQII